MFNTNHKWQTFVIAGQVHQGSNTVIISNRSPTKITHLAHYLLGPWPDKVIQTI